MVDKIVVEKDKQIFLTNEIIFESLFGTPELIKMPVLGGIDTEFIRILNFKLTFDKKAYTSLFFDNEIKHLQGIYFGFKGKEDIFIEEYNYERARQRALIVKSGNKDIKNTL